MRAGDLVVDATAVKVPYLVTIEEGHLYKLGTIHLPPDSLLTQAELDKMVSQQNSTTASECGTVEGRGDPRNLGGDLGEIQGEGISGLRNRATSGFRQAASVVNYTVEIKPGAVYHLGLLRFDNVSEEVRRRLMRQLADDARRSV